MGRSTPRTSPARRPRTRLDRRADRSAGLRWRRARRCSLYEHGNAAECAERRDPPMKRWREWLLYAEATVIALLTVASLLSGVWGLVAH